MPTRTSPIEAVSSHQSLRPQVLNLPVVTEAAATDEVAALYAHFREHFGRPRIPGILQCFATHPPLLEHMMGIADGVLFREGSLGRRRKELLATFVSAANGCAYCADSHGFSLRANGGTDEDLEAALACRCDSPALSPGDQALLRFASRISANSASITTVEIEDLRDQGFTDLAIAEAIHLTALFAAFNRIVNAFGLASQELLGTARMTAMPQGLRCQAECKEEEQYARSE